MGVVIFEEEAEVFLIADEAPTEEGKNYLKVRKKSITVLLLNFTRFYLYCLVSEVVDAETSNLEVFEVVVGEETEMVTLGVHLLVTTQGATLHSTIHCYFMCF